MRLIYAYRNQYGKNFTFLYVFQIRQFSYEARFNVKVNDNPMMSPRGPTFLEFIKYILYFNKETQFWRDYEKQCSFCETKYDFILKYMHIIYFGKVEIKYICFVHRFENLPIEAKYMIDYLKLNPPLNHLNPSSLNSQLNSMELRCKYLSQLDGETLNDLNKKYQDDFYTLGYKTQLNLCNNINYTGVIEFD